MRSIGIIGFGVLGQQILNFLKEATPIDNIFIFDDHTKKQENVFSFNHYQSSEFQYLEFYIGLGYKHLHVRTEILESLKKMKRSVPSFIHSSSYISPSANIGDGCLIFPKCNIDQMVSIDDGNILHNSVTISHDSIIGKCNYFSPSVTLAGYVRMGNRTFIGAASTLCNNIKIGDNVIIGIASAVTQDVPNDVSVIGNPLKTLSKKLNVI